MNLTQVPGVGQPPPSCSGGPRPGWVEAPQRTPCPHLPGDQSDSGQRIPFGPLPPLSCGTEAWGPQCRLEIADLSPLPQDLTGGVFEDNLRSLNLQEGRDFLHFS